MRSSSSGRQAADKALHSGPTAGVRREAGQGRPDLVQGEPDPLRGWMKASRRRTSRRKRR